MADSEQIAQFIELTGASTAEAHQFLQGSDLQTAIATYFAAQDDEHGAGEEGNSDDDIEMTGATQGGVYTPAPAASRPVTTGGTGYTLSGAPIPASSEPISRPSSTSGTTSGPRIGRIGGPPTAGRGNASSSTGGARIGTLSSLNAADSGDESEDDDDPRRKAEFYAGGGKSGLAIQGPDDGKRGTTGEDLVKEILARAKEGGERAEEPMGRGKGKAAAAGRSVFSGTGMTLGSDQVESVTVPDPTAAPRPQAPQPGRAAGGMGGYLAQIMGGAGPGAIPGMADAVHDQEEQDEEEVQVRHLTFWQDGFSVEDGPLMKYDDPANQEILAAIKAGRAPLSILNVKFGSPVELRVAQRQSEAYQPPPKQPAKPFSGSGNRLGSPAPDLVSHSTSGAGAGAAMPGGFTSNAAPPTAVAPIGNVGLEVNESKPTTSVQVRLADGTKIVAKLNLDHTVGDIRRFISAAQPGSRAYVIQTTFPNKTLDDNSLTIEQAGLKNAVVVQRWT